MFFNFLFVKFSLFKEFFLKRSMCAPISSLFWKNVCICTLKEKAESEIVCQHVKVLGFYAFLSFIPLLEECRHTAGEADSIYYHISSRVRFWTVFMPRQGFGCPKMSSVCASRENFDFHCRGLLFIAAKFRPIGQAKKPADCFAYTFAFFGWNYPFFI